MRLNRKTFSEECAYSFTPCFSDPFPEARIGR